MCNTSLFLCSVQKFWHFKVRLAISVLPCQVSFGLVSIFENLRERSFFAHPQKLSSIKIQNWHISVSKCRVFRIICFENFTFQMAGVGVIDLNEIPRFFGRLYQYFLDWMKTCTRHVRKLYCSLCIFNQHNWFLKVVNHQVITYDVPPLSPVSSYRLGKDKLPLLY